jgi:hypothetical protein
MIMIATSCLTLSIGGNITSELTLLNERSASHIERERSSIVQSPPFINTPDPFDEPATARSRPFLPPSLSSQLSHL